MTTFVNPYMHDEAKTTSAESPEFVEPMPTIAPIIPLIIGLFGLALGTANFVNGTVRGEISKQKLQEMEEKLDRLLTGQIEIVGLLQIIFQEIKWSEILVQTSAAVNNINYQYDAMLEIVPGDNNGAAAWADAVLDESNGLTKDLFVINDVVMGQTIFNPALMQIYTQRLLAAGSTTQSNYYDAITFFRDVLLIEGKGICALANAYTYKNSSWDGSKFYTKWENILKTQAAFSKQFIDPLDQFYWNPAWGNNWFSFSQSYCFVDTNENIPNGGEQCVVVGLQLYVKGNRCGLKVLQANIDAQGLVDQSSSKWRDSPGWGNEYFENNESHYVDTNVTVVPAGNIVIGAALYKKGNRVAIRLQSVPFDPSTGKADFSKKQWTESPGWGENYFDWNSGGVKTPVQRYANLWPVQPTPLSFVTGVTLFNFGNRMALKLNTVYYTD